ncbi:DNA-methyltransferase [Thermus caliditerrae]|uniref:DNA-methyltransferase n=1 Tax=Thermus caliditerrae TaxID=1330700 RepID=UPI001F44ADAC|nr:site-specific DNA-methyltransferase [Thermus caliditerrae]
MELVVKDTFDPDAHAVIYSGDCLELLAQVPDASIALVITSPPYNIGKPYEDRTDLEAYLSWQERVIQEAVRIIKPTGSLVWQVGNYVENGEILPLDILLYPIFKRQGLQLRNRIVWAFEHGLHAKRRFSGRYEVALWLTKSETYTFHLDRVRVPQKYPNKRHFKGPKKGQISSNPLGKNPGDVWIFPNVKANHVEKTAHPAQFPVELVERFVLALTEEEDWVLDPFGGSGTTLIAALMHRRKGAMAEILPDYVTIAKQRLRDAWDGRLRVRPMEREVYDPSGKAVYIPPKVVDLRAVWVPPLFSEAQ